DSTKKGAWKNPLLMLLGDSPALSPASRTTRGPAGASRSPDGASRDERQSAPLEREHRPVKTKRRAPAPPRPAPGALRGGVSPRSPRLDRPPAPPPQVAD